jgi:hypothetical protein
LADVNANIGINFDTSQALAQLRQLQSGLSRFNQTLTQGNISAMNAQKGLNAQLVQAINATGKFVATQKDVATSTSSFTSALEKNQLSMRQYFRYTAAAASQNTRVFKGMFAQERETLVRASKDRVKLLQSQYIQMQAANGDMIKVLQVIPKHLKMVNGQYADYATRMQMAAQRQQFLNQLLKQGSTQLLNFGKNTQWAGRQLMVGLTIPLSILGSTAAKTFMEMEQAVTKFSRVYGDITTGNDATNKAIADIQLLAKEFTKYGIGIKDTIEMAGKAAAMGLTGNALNAQVIQATRLAVLGQVEQQQALETTISLTNAFGIASEDLSKKINFLNAVENQTVLSIEDLTIAIPKAGPVIKQLGGSVEDLAFFMTAMKEGGINASEGANALKSGLAAMINPSKKVSAMLADLGINISGIVNANAGDLKGTVVGFARALDTLDPLNRARAIEQLFGKFQFARLSTLFQNVTKDSSQAARALGLAGSSVEELAILSERELGKVENAVGVKFQKTIEDLKTSLVPVGKAFLEALTPVVAFFGKILDKFNNFSDGTKKAIAIVVGVVGGLAPVALMTFGLLANGLANLIKFFAMLRGGMAKLNGQNSVLGGGFDYLTQQELENIAETNALHMSHKTLIDTFNVEAASVNLLANAYANAASQARALAASSPGLFNAVPGAKGAVSGLPKFADGGVVPGIGNKDTVAAMLTPGEVVLTKETVKNNPELIAALQNNAVKKYHNGTDNSRSGSSYRNTNSLILGKGLPGATVGTPGNMPASQSEAITPTSKLPGYLQKEYDRIEKLTETNLRRYADITGQGVGKSLEEIKTIVLADFESLLSEVKAKFGSITKEGLTTVGKKFDEGRQSSRMGAYNPDFDQLNRPEFSHVGQTKPVTSSYDKGDGLNLSPAARNQVELIKKFYGDGGGRSNAEMPELKVADAHGMMLKGSLNNAMSTPGKSKAYEAKNGAGSLGVDFQADFEKTGAQKWQAMTTMMGGDFDQLKSQAEIYDNMLIEKLKTWNSQNAAKPVPEIFDDATFKAIESQITADLQTLAPEFSLIVEKAKQSITAIRISLGEDFDEVNAMLKANGAGTLGPRASNAKILNHEARPDSPQLLGTISKEVDADLTNAERIAQTASPSKRTKKLGKDIAQGLKDGLAESTPEVKAQSDKLAEAAMPDGSVKDMPIGVLVDNTEESAIIVGDSVDVLSDNKDSLISTTELNEAISKDTNELQIEGSDAVAKQKRINDLRDQELLAKQRITQNAKDAANQSQVPFTSQSDKVAGDVGFIGPLPQSMDKNYQAQEMAAGRAARKLKIKEARGMRRESVGRYSGKAAGALGTASMIAGMTGAPAQVTGALGAASMVTSMAPMIAGMGPGGAIAAAITATVGGLYLLNKSAESAAKAQAAFANKTQMNASTLKSIGESTGKVGATEIMDRRRSEAEANRYTTNYDRKGQQFGTTFLSGDAGKSMADGFAENIKIAGKDQAVAQFASNLALAVSDGVMTAVEASDVARQMAIKFGDTTLQPKIDGELNRLIGPFGEDLLKDPLQVRINLIDNQSEISQSATDQLAQMQKDYGSSFLGNTTGGGFAGNAKGRDFSFGELFGQTENEKVAAFGAASGVNNYSAASSQLDAYTVESDKKIKELETQRSITTEKSKQALLDAQIKTAYIDQASGQQKIRDKMSDVLKQQIDLFHVAEQRGAVEDSYFDSLKESVKLKYKGTAMEGFTGTLLEKSADLKSKELEVTVNTLVASGQVNPLVMTDILEAFAGDEDELKGVLDIGVKTHGADKIAMLVNNLGGIKKPELKKKLAISLSKLATEDMDRVNATLTQLQTMDQKDFDINVWLGTDAEEAQVKLLALQKQLEAIEKAPDPLTKSIQLENLGIDANAMAGITANWEYFMSLPETVRKTAIQTYVSAYTTVNDDAINTRISKKVKTAGGAGGAVQQYYATPEGRSQVANELALEATTPQYSANGIPSKDGKNGNGGGGGDKKNPLDFLDSLAMRIKNVRDGAFDATNPLKSMMAAFSGKAAQKDVSKMFTLFDGLQQRMLKMGVPKEFREMIAGMSAEDFKAFSELPKGKNMFTYNEKDAKGNKLPKTKQNIKGLTKEGKAVMQTYREAQVGEFQVVQQEVVASIKEQDKSFKLLVASGMSASDALLVVEDKAIAAGIAAGAIGKKGSVEMNNFIADTKAANDALSVQAAFNKARSAKAEFEIFKNMPELAKNMKAAGYSAEQIESAIGDPDIAKYLLQDLKDGKVEAGDIKDYLDQIAERKRIDIKVGFEMQDWGKVTDEGRQLVDEMFAAEEALIRTGAKGQEINTNGLKISDLEQEIAPFQTRINKINQSISDNQRTIDITYTRPIEAVQTAVEKLNRQLETSPIFGNRLMEKIQEQNTMYSNDLAIISHESEKINTAYDKQLESLTATTELNDQIIAQQGMQLGLADALTQGDIAAAAKAAQEMKAANAANFADSQSKAIDRARSNALGGLKGAQSGMTQKQIEEAQYQNSQKLYKIETDPARVKILSDIKSLQDAIYSIEQEKSTLLATIQTQEDEVYKIQNNSIRPLQDQVDKLVARNTQLQASIDKEVAAIEVLGKNRDAWNNVNAKIDYAKLASKNLDTAFGGLLAGVEAIDGKWADILAKMKTYATGVPDSVVKEQAIIDPLGAEQKKIAAENVKKMEILNKTAPTIQAMIKAGNVDKAENATVSLINEMAKVSTLTSEQIISARKRSLGYLNSGGSVPKYFASGGRALGSDTVQAMLTPGEFVMSKYAVQTHGIGTMKAINNGSSPLGDSVYNYNLSVNVKSDANPNDIAQAVMTHIKSIDSQRIRGSRI